MTLHRRAKLQGGQDVRQPIVSTNNLLVDLALQKEIGLSLRYANASMCHFWWKTDRFSSNLQVALHAHASYYDVCETFNIIYIRER